MILRLARWVASRGRRDWESEDWMRYAIEKMDVAEKRQVLQLLDAFIERGQLKRKAQAGAAR